MKRLVFLSLLFFLFVKVEAQQDPMFSHYMFNDLFINPGFAGSSSKIDATLLQRQQWVGFEGAPQTTLFSIQSPFNFLGKKHGAGLTIVSDKLGFDKNFTADLSYAYHMDMWGGDLGLGLDLGIFNKALDASGFNPPSSGSDLSIPNSGSDLTFNLGLGAFYKNEKLYAGLSVSHILQPKFQIDNKNPFYLKRHYFFTAGYEVQLPNPMFELTPTILVKSDLASYQATVNVKVTYDKRFWGGLGYRYQDAVIAMAGIELANHVRIGYAYDLNVSSLRAYNGGSHEVMLNYAFTLSTERIPQKYKSVRFL